ncbi:MAG: lysophospholipase [Chitinophagales bacterium]
MTGEVNQGWMESQGLKIFYRSWQPEEVKAVLILVHGAGDHSGRYLHVGEFFSQKGLAVLAPDLRGQGDSEGVRGHVGDFEEYLQDVSHMIEAARKQYPEVPVFLLGHSMGGTIGALYGITRPGKVQGILLSSPCMGLVMKINPVKKLVGKLVGKVVPKLTVPDGIDPSWVSRSPEVVAAYATDNVRCGRVTASWYNAFEAAWLKALAQARDFKYPCLILQAGDDRLVEKEKSELFYQQISSKDKTFRFCEGCYHEIMNEPEKEKVLQDMWNWIMERI